VISGISAGTMTAAGILLLCRFFWAMAALEDPPWRVSLYAHLGAALTVVGGFWLLGLAVAWLMAR
jgi:hypothetical protein